VDNFFLHGTKGAAAPPVGIAIKCKWGGGDEMELRVGGFKRRGLVESLVGRGEKEGRRGANPPFGKIIRELHKKSVWRNQLLLS